MRLVLVLCCLVLAACSASAEQVYITFNAGDYSLGLLLSPEGSDGFDDLDQQTYKEEAPMAWFGGPTGLLQYESRLLTLPQIFEGRVYKDPRYNVSVAGRFETDISVALSLTSSWGESWSVVLNPGTTFGFGVPSGTPWDNRFQVTVSAVPEPSGIIALLAGLSTLVTSIFRRLRRTRVEAFFVGQNNL